MSRIYSQLKGTKKRRAVESAALDSEGTWAISYGDLMTLLVSFFIVFVSMKEQPKFQQKALEHELVQKLVAHPDEQRPQKKTEIKTEITQPGSETEQLLDKALIAKWGGRVQALGSRIIVDFPGLSFFKRGEVNLTLDGEIKLRTFASLYLPFAGKHRLAIRAYTDSSRVIPKKNRHFQDNLELSALRSVSAMRAIQHSGIPLDRITLGGHGVMEGEQELLNQMKTPGPWKAEDYQKMADLERRVTLVIEPEEKTETKPEEKIRGK